MFVLQVVSHHQEETVAPDSAIVRLVQGSGLQECFQEEYNGLEVRMLLHET